LALECVCEGGGSAVAGGEHEQDATAEERPPAFSGGQATVGEAGSAGGNRAETERLRGGELECERAGGTAAGERDTTTAGAGERRCEYLPRERARSAAAAVSSRRSAGAPGPAEASAASMFGVSVGVPARISSVLAPGPPWARKSRPCRSPLGPSANSTAPEAAPPDDCLPNRTSSAAAAASTATASSASRRRCGTPCTTRA
jgi:hypothetical protein